MMNDQSLFSSLHTHTIFCDGEDDIETMCRAAYEKKLYSIGFSAHAPIPSYTGIRSNWHLKEDRLDEYIDEVNAAKFRWKGKLEVFLGLEVDYIKGLRSSNDDDIKKINADYLIGSVHYLIPAGYMPESGGSSCKCEPFTVDGPPEEFENGLENGFDGNAEALMNSYYDTLSEMIMMGGFDILGHADLVKKNCQKKTYWDKDSELVRQKEIALAAFLKDIVVEVNTGGLNRGITNDVYPSLNFLRLFREHQCKIIITADAHKAEHLICNYDIALQTIKDAGFNEHLIFIGKNEQKAVWKKENI